MIKLLEILEKWLIKRNSYTRLYLDNELYFDRFYLFRSEKFAIVLHKFYSSDKYLHCHPWNNASFVLTGGYNEERFDGTTIFYKPGSFSFRQAEVFHKISKVHEPGKTWSLFITGPRKRIWGQIKENKWIPITARLDEGLVGYVFPRRISEDTVATHRR